MLHSNEHVLFLGDSVTDSGRTEWADNNADMGWGYAAVTAGTISARRPELKLRFSNRGVSGNRVYDLEARLEKDVLALKPDVVTILIGINDTWRRYDNNTPSPIPEFMAAYRRIVKAIQGQGGRVVMLEPFALLEPAERKTWREDLGPRIIAVRELAAEFGAPYVPLDGIFAAACTQQPPAYWAADGVHPTFAGHCLIAEHLAATLLKS